MRRAIVAGLFLLSVTAFGQYRDRDRYRDPRYEDRRYNNASPVSRVIGNLDRIDSRAWVDRHERDHFNNARNDLYAFESRLQQGRFENRYLDHAIDNMKHLANARQLAPRDRGMIMRDIDELRALRARGGGYYRGY